MRRIKLAVLAAVLPAVLLGVVPASAQAVPGDIEITEFTVTPLPSPLAPGGAGQISPTDAGAHPNLRLRIKFCTEGFDIEGTRIFCNESQFPGAPTGLLKDFLLRLPPGLLGNPTSVTPCPTHSFLAGACPPSSRVGYSVTRATNSNQRPSVDVPTPLYVVEATGLEPARLGTTLTYSTPPGPFPVLIGVRSTGDFGIDSALQNIPWVLGQIPAKIMEIDTVLCAQAPCHPTNSTDARTVVPDDPLTAKPFAVNPTSCDPAITGTEVRSYEFPNKPVTAQSDWVDDPATPDVVDPVYTPSFTPTNCQNVPFNPDVTVTPDTTAAGQPSGYSVAIQYPDYRNDPLWQSALKDADVTLPEGVTLAPGGGVGLEQCTAAQFGVQSYSPLTVDAEPVKCPEGSEIGTVKVDSPVLDTQLQGRAFFGPPTAPGRPTPESPWKLFLLIEGEGLRIKLVGNVSVGTNGQIRTTFLNQPEVPFTRFELHTRGGDRAVLANPTTCTAHAGHVVLNGYSGASKTITPTVTPTGCSAPAPFAPSLDEVAAEPTQAGAFSKSKLIFTRPDGHQQLQKLTLALPAGATGSLNVVPLCPAAVVRALGSNASANCSDDSKVGNIKTTVGSGNNLLEAPGSLYLGEPVVGGDAASFVIVVPAKVGPIDLGRVVVINRVRLRPADVGVNVHSADIPTVLEGVPIPVRKIEINVDRDDFFLNPTGCDPRTFVATFVSDLGTEASSSRALAATGCNRVPFTPRIRLIAGAKNLTKAGAHPPLKAIVTQLPGEASISNARVVIPDTIRPNVPQFQRPGALCSEAQLAARACPALSQIGDARVKTPLLPFSLSGPVYIVQETGKPLPKLAVFLRGGGLEVVLNATNGFQGIKILNVFSGIPDVPQSYFELNVKGGSNGILNAFTDLCKSGAPKAKPSAAISAKKKKAKRKKRKRGPQIEAIFTGHNGKRYTTKPRLEVRGCAKAKKATKKKSTKRRSGSRR